MGLSAHAEPFAQGGRSLVQRIETRLHPVQAELTEGQVEDRAGRFGREPLAAVVRVEDPADLTAAVVLAAQEQDHVTGELAGVATPHTQRRA